MVNFNDKMFSGKKEFKLGSKKNPATVSVQTEKRKEEVTKIFEDNDWAYKINLNADKPEDITELEILQNPVQGEKIEKKVGRNEPCSCGSGKKYKKCCAK